jgi:transcriptional regulator with XRE-family HTH domain
MNITEDIKMRMTSQLFKKARLELNLTQQELGDVLGMTRQHIGQIEKGNSPVQKQTVLALDQLAYLQLTDPGALNRAQRPPNALDNMFEECLQVLDNLSIR